MYANVVDEQEEKEGGRKSFDNEDKREGGNAVLMYC